MTAASAERHLVAAIYVKPELGELVFDQLSGSEAFVDPPARRFYEAVHAVHSAGAKLTVPMLKREYERRGWSVEELFRVATESRDDLAPITEATVETNLRLVLEDWNLRRFRQAFAAVKSWNDVRGLADDVAAWEAGTATETPETLGSLLHGIAHDQDAIAAGRVTVGYPFGIEDLDEHIALRMSTLTTIAGVRGVGKSQLVLFFLLSNALSDRPLPCLLFSLEMDARSIAKRVLANITRMNSRLIDSRHTNEDQRAQMREAAAEHVDTRFDIVDRAGLGVREIAARTRSWRLRHGITDALVAVDYVQLVRREQQRGENTADALDRVAQALFELAKRERVAVVAAAQLNRVGATAEGPPDLSHVRGGEGIAMASDNVLAITTDPDDGTKDHERRRMLVFILKQRGGEAGVRVPVIADLARNQFNSVTSPSRMFGQRGRNTVADT